MPDPAIRQDLQADLDRARRERDEARWEVERLSKQNDRLEWQARSHAMDQIELRSELARVRGVIRRFVADTGNSFHLPAELVAEGEKV